MKKNVLLSFFILSSYLTLKAQINYKYFDSIQVYKSGHLLDLAWAGGINYPQFSEIDLNRDGKKDLFVFDRASGIIKLFINESNTPGISKYAYAPQYAKKFPSNLKDFVLLRDYNCDGELDLFSQGSGGIKLYRNDYASVQDLSFTQMVEYYLVSDYGLSFPINIWNSQTDIPAIEDFDNDNDLDILIFPISGTALEYHKNRTQENYTVCDSLDYELITSCWGNFYESSFSNYITLNISCKGATGAPHDTTLHNAHSGSTILAVDLEKDGDKDVLLGGVSYWNMVAVTNGGDINTANGIAVDSAFPSYNVPVNVLFPAAFYVDADNDNVKDIVVASNASSIPAVFNNYESAWFYKNIGKNDSLVLQLTKRNFLQDEMIEVGEGANPAFFDYNADGLLDLVIGNYAYFDTTSNFNGTLTLYKNIGNAHEPKFEFVTNNYANLSIHNLNGLYPTFGDLDNDGDQDLIIGDKNGKINYFENLAGSGNPANFQLNTLNYKGIDIGSYATPQLVDVDDDGLIDLLIGEREGTINFYKNTGTLMVPDFAAAPSNSMFGGIDVDVQCCSGYSSPFLTTDNGNKVLFVGSEKGKIYYYDQINGNLNGNFNLNDSITEVQGRISVSGANILGQSKEELIIGDYLGGVTLLKHDSDVFVHTSQKELKEMINLYPNPFNENFQINLNYNPTENMSADLYDIYGKLILKTIVNKKVSTIHTKSIANGVYILKLTGKGVNLEYKIVKN